MSKPRSRSASSIRTSTLAADRHDQPRARLRAVAFAAGLTLLLLTGAHDRRIEAQSACGATINPVACENLQPGTSANEWQITGAGDPTIQGFATQFSLAPGQTQQFKIDTPASQYSIEIFRMGYYSGLGARRVATIAPSAPLPQSQPDCLTQVSTGLIDCGNWAVSASWPVPSTAVSGIYFAKLTRPDTGGDSHIFFVVRNDTGQSDILFQTSDTTWQAYNSYGGNSLYVGGPGTNPGRAYKVSYNRPFNTRAGSPEDFVFNAEYPMVRWLEANGFDVSYSSGADTDRFGAELLEHKVFMSVGHDEYWSGGQRANVEAARAAGVHLAFFSGNEVFWKTRWENAIDGSGTTHRTLVSYKETHANAVIDPADPPTWTGTWRDPRFSPPGDGGRPENALTGTIFKANDGTSSITVPSAEGKLRFWRNTSVATLSAGQTATLPNGTLGYEWDEAPNNAFTPAGLMRLSSTTRTISSMLLDYGSTYGSGTLTHHLTLYRHASGALVFGAGTIQWSWGLDSNHDRGSTAADVRMKQATVNLLADMGVQPETIEAGLTTATASTDVLAPTSAITSPSPGASISAGTNVTISGTASEAGGGIVTAVEVSVDGGATWTRATGTTSWTMSWTATGSGSRTIQSRAYDDSGNSETPSAGVTVTITAGQTCPCTIWPAASVPPAPVDDGDALAVEVGTRFRADVDGFITGVRFYKATLNTGTHTGRLWTNAGTLLGTVTFTGETASGWQQADFASAIPITANTTYVVSYHAPNGHYTGTDAYFAAGGVVNPPLQALRDGIDGLNGVYRYGAGGVFPTDTYQSEGYWADVVFTTVAPPDTTAPTITSRFPASGATGVDPAAAVTVTFSEAMNASTISSSTAGGEGGGSLGTFELRDPSNILVAATVSYDAVTRVATLRPDSSLALSTTFTAIVKGGAADPRVKDLAGNALAATSTWTFTTAAAPPPPPTCPCSIWTPTTVPQKIDDGDPSSVELGTRFRSDVAGWVTGARFYKGALNTGTHVAKLWTNTGALLGSATFTGETASGWQETVFATPIAITANTTYLISYHANNGHYSSQSQYFASAGVDRAPLHALRDGVDGANGVYQYGTSAFPTQTFQSEGYFIDVVFNTSIGPDTTPPTVTSASPIAGLSGVATSTNVLVTFNEAMSATTITGTTFSLRDPASNLVTATVTYDPGTRTATLDPSAPLANLTTYTATVKGGTTDPRVKDTAGNALAANYTWSFTTAAPPPPPPTEGPGGPVLVITSGTNPFTTYLAEILRTEGLNAFATADLSAVNAGTLAVYDVVVLGEMALSAAQVTMFTNWVNQGGNLIAMRPDKQLAGLMGLTDAGTTLSNAYLLVNTSAPPGAGIVGQTMQFHGTADRYTLGGATSVATLYSAAAVATANPAVTMRSVGASGGHAVAFTYDLARSVVYTRQGNPAWSGQERDGFAPIRSDDLYFGARAGDVQPDWVDLTKVAIPQADEQQRLLWNTLLHINASRKPLPRFWYFPRMLKAVVIMTGDDHGNNGTAGRFDQYLTASAPNCSVTDWTCIRGTSYIFPNTPLSAGQITNYISQGFELALHVNTQCADYTPATLASYYSTQLAQFAAAYPAIPPPTTNRTHCIVWSDYATQPQVELSNGIRLDTTYYYWPGSWVLDRPGMFTGSGMPMRFATSTGAMVDVYQAATQMTDESEQSYPFHADTLFNRALGAEGYYGAFTANMHTDANPSPGSIGSDAIIAAAVPRGVPVITARQMLDWLDGRNGSSFESIVWTGNVLSFDIAVGAGANGLRALVPASANGAPISDITLNGASKPFTLETIKGVSYAVFAADSGSYQIGYGVDATPPVISAIAVNVPDNTAQVQWTTNEGADSLVSFGTDPGALTQTASDPALVTSHTITLPGLSSATTYYYRVSSADAIGNTSVSPAPPAPPLSFTTPTPSISIAGVSVTEGNSGTANAGFVVTMSPASTQVVTVGYATANGTASAGSDFTAAAGTLTFNVGETSQTINVVVAGDVVAESAETFTVNLSTPVNAMLGTATATGTILNDDSLPSISITDPSITEGDTGTTNAVFNVTLSGESGSTVTVAYTTADGTATAGADFVTTSGTLTFAPGVTTQSVTVPVLGDLLNESDEPFVVNLTAPVNATIAKAQGTGTIANNDPVPSITIADVSKLEGNTGTSNATLTLTLSAASGKTVTVAYATANGTATAGSDYVAASGTATIAAGATSVAVNVTVNGDTLFEPDETFVVDLSAPANATIADAQATVTIQNDEATPSLSIGNASVAEGNAGTVNASFAVTLSSASSQTITVSYATADGTAAAGSDYAAASGSLTFAPGATSQTVIVQVAGDTLNEPAEQFFMNLSNAVNAPIATAQGTGTITNDDPLPSIAIADVSVTEGNSGTTTAAFTLTLSAASGQTVTVGYATANGSATTAGSDYVAASGTATFTPGATSAVVNVTVNGDTLPESTETFVINLSSPANATIADAQATGTIVNDEPLPSLAIGNAAVIEGNGGSANAVFTVSLTPASSQTVSVSYATANGSATAGSDYTAASGTLTFLAGETSKVVNVAVGGDTLHEPDEQFAVSLSGAVAATIAAAQGTGTITNDDPVPSIAIGDVSITEGNSGTKLATFTLTLSGGSSSTVTVSYATANGTATAGSDYVAAAGTASFAPGTTSAAVSVTLNGDAVFEGDEAFVLNLGSPANATIADAQGIGVILNDEAVPALTIGDVTIVEGNSGTVNAVLNVTLAPVSSQIVTASWATANGTATAGSDYTAASGTVTFAPGASAQTITILVTGDTASEPNETFVVNLSSPANAVLLDGQGVVTIANDEVTGLVAAYGFSEGSGTTAADASGSGHAGSVSGATWTAQGHTGNALSFDGVNDLVTVADTAALDVTRVTLMAWLRPTTLSGWRTAILKENGSDGLAYALYAHDNAPRPSGYINVGGPDRTVDGTAALAVNTWTHLAMTYDGTNMRLYVNGVLVRTKAQTGNIVASTQALHIGGNVIWGEWFAGLIDDVRIYNRALTQTEVQNDMNTAVQ